MQALSTISSAKSVLSTFPSVIYLTNWSISHFKCLHLKYLNIFILPCVYQSLNVFIQTNTAYEMQGGFQGRQWLSEPQPSDVLSALCDWQRVVGDGGEGEEFFIALILTNVRRVIAAPPIFVRMQLYRVLVFRTALR